MDKLRAVRIEKGWSQGRLAEAIDASEASIYRWERGITSPSIADIEKVAKALGVNVGDLIDLNPTRRRRSREKSESTATAQA